MGLGQRAPVYGAGGLWRVYVTLRGRGLAGRLGWGGCWAANVLLSPQQVGCGKCSPTLLNEPPPRHATARAYLLTRRRANLLNNFRQLPALRPHLPRQAVWHTLPAHYLPVMPHACKGLLVTSPTHSDPQDGTTKLLTANVGDARIVLVRSTGEAVQLSEVGACRGRLGGTRGALLSRWCSCAWWGSCQGGGAAVHGGGVVRKAVQLSDVGGMPAREMRRWKGKERVGCRGMANVGVQQVMLESYGRQRLCKLHAKLQPDQTKACRAVGVGEEVCPGARVLTLDNVRHRWFARGGREEHRGGDQGGDAANGGT